MLLTEFFDNVFSKNKGNSSLVFAPTGDVVRISPEKVAKNPLVRDVLRPRDAIDLGEVLEIRRKPSMHTENSLVNNRTDREIVEHRAEVSPQGKTVAPLALVVKPVKPGDRVAFVIAPQEINHVRALYLVDQEQAHRLNRLLASINKVSD